MDSQIVQRIRETMQAKSTDELLRIWEENDRGQYSDEAFEAVTQVLTGRGESLPPQPAPKTKVSSEALTKKKTPIWKMIFCVLLLLPGGWYILEMIKYQLYDTLMGVGLYFMKDFIFPFLVIFIAMWGATFLWPRWCSVLGLGCLVWGVVNVREGVMRLLGYEFSTYYIRSILDEIKVNSYMGLVIIIMGFALLGFDIYRWVVKKETPTICSVRGVG